MYELWVFNIGSDALLYLFTTTTLELKGRLKHFSDGLKTALLVLFLLPAPIQAAPRVATSDWSTAETLTAMGHPPVSVGDKRAYGNWVNYPPLPNTTLDAGLRFQPNLERLYQIKPDMFIQSPWFAHLKPQFEKVAPVREISFAGDKGIAYPQTLAATRELGSIIGDKAAAERLIQKQKSNSNSKKTRFFHTASGRWRWCSLSMRAIYASTATPACLTW